MHRLAMVELAIADHPGLEVDALEIQRRGRSYTVDTLEELRRELPSRTLALIVGGDAFLGLPRWHRWRELLALAHLIVVARPGVAFQLDMPPALAVEWTARLRNDASALSTERAGAIVVQPITAHPISASAIRSELARGAEGIAVVRGLLPASVLAYIDRNQLYRSRPDAA